MLLIALVLVGAIVAPMIYFPLLKKAKEKKLLDTLQAFAQEHGGKISEHDFWKSTSIGIDKDRHLLFFLRKKEDREQKLAIDLSGVKHCKIVNTNKGVNTSYGNERVVEKLELSLAHNEPGKADTILEFYNVDHDSLTLTWELQLIEKWLKIINTNLVAVPVGK